MKTSSLVLPPPTPSIKKLSEGGSSEGAPSHTTLRESQTKYLCIYIRIIITPPKAVVVSDIGPNLYVHKKTIQIPQEDI